MRSKTGPIEPRPTCYACHRPSSHCVCSLVEPFQAHCNILILQHPHERRKYYSTAKLVLGALTNSSLLRGVTFDSAILESALGLENTYLLFPDPNARDCSAVALNSSSTVVVIDGTWSEAGKIFRRNPLLQQLPCLSFSAPLRSEYRIRKQPKEQYLSTVESIAHLLRLNAIGQNASTDVTRYDGLLTAFGKMVEQQLAYFPRMRGVGPLASPDVLVEKADMRTA